MIMVLAAVSMIIKKNISIKKNILLLQYRD